MKVDDLYDESILKLRVFLLRGEREKSKEGVRNADCNAKIDVEHRLKGIRFSFSLFVLMMNAELILIVNPHTHPIQDIHSPTCAFFSPNILFLPANEKL